MVINHRMVMTTKMRKTRMMNPQTPKRGKPRMNSLRTQTMLGWASSTSRRPCMGKPWQRCSATSATSPSMMQMPSWCTLAFIALRTFVLSTKTTGRTLLPSGRNAIRTEMVLSAQWSCRRLSKTVSVVLHGHAATMYDSSGPHHFSTSNGCVHSILKPSMPRWNVRKKAR